MTIRPVGALAPALPSAASASAPDAPAAPAIAAAAPAASRSAAPLLNPDPVIDPGLGIVVLQYFSPSGTETRSVPSRQLIDRYQLHDLAAPSAGAAQNPTPTPTANGAGAYA